MEYGFFYLINHGVEEELLKRVFEESRKFFVLPSEEKMKVVLKDHRGYTPLYAEKLDPSSISKGDSKESFYVGPLEDVKNQWPPAAELGVADQQMYGASAHSDYGMITLLAAEDVGGLQICREKFEQNQVWEDVHHVNGAFIVNIADMMERWTNCLFRSTFHRVLPTGRERYSAAFFLDGNPDCMVECLKSCCSESRPPRYPPIRIGDHLQQRFRITYG
ncbi:azadirone synthase LFS-like isoform X2 [Coffea arabica]